MSAPAWFHNRIITGLQRLYSLNLDHSPAADMLPTTADTWVAVLWPPRLWYQDRDEPRLGQAFRALAGKVERWPAPKALMDCMPAVPEAPMLPAPAYRPSPEKIAKARAVVAGLAGRLTKLPKERS